MFERVFTNARMLSEWKVKEVCPYKIHIDIYFYTYVHIWDYTMDAWGRGWSQRVKESEGKKRERPLYICIYVEYIHTTSIYVWAPDFFFFFFFSHFYYHFFSFHVTVETTLETLNSSTYIQNYFHIFHTYVYMYIRYVVYIYLKKLMWTAVYNAHECVWVFFRCIYNIPQAKCIKVVKR